jgi:transcriptional regulator with XRE-family HTH domain
MESRASSSGALSAAEVAGILDVIAGELRAVRTARGLSLRALEREVGIPYGTLSRLERRATAPDGETLIRVARWLRQQARRTAESDDGPRR